MHQVDGRAGIRSDAGPAARAGSVTQKSARRSGRLPALVWLVGAAFVAVEVAVSGRYGFMQDELYFIDAGRHLAFGYVDQPPLMPLLDRVTGVFGLNPSAIRIIPALAGGAIVVITGRLAALFGAGRLGQVLAALAMACAPVLIGATHLGNTTPVELLAWAVVLLCVVTAIARDKPRWWLGAGVAAGLGLEDNYLMITLLAALAAGLACSVHRSALRTTWPWLGAAIALLIWAPNLGWQAAHGWPQLAMSSALHQGNSSAADYADGLPAQLIEVGLLVVPLVIAGFVRLWRNAELRFIAIAASLIVGYVLAWVPGKTYYADGIVPAVLAAGAVAAERWIGTGRRPALRRTILVAAPLVGAVALLPLDLPLVPVGDVHRLPASSQQNSVIGDTVGFPQLASAVIRQDRVLARAGEPPTSIFAGYYGESAALDVLSSANRLPPVLSGQNAYWMWGPGSASDRTVLVVDALATLRPYFANCRLLTTYNAPYQMHNDWTGIGIGVCTGPSGGWSTLWPHLRYFG